MKIYGTLRERLLSKAVINWETGCWEWTATKDRYGYGRICIQYKYTGAHRVAYELIEGPIPEGLDLDHLCLNKGCINPAHLEPVTRRENTRRASLSISSINSAKTHCVNGHEFTPDNTLIRRGARDCRACNRSRAFRNRARARAEKQLNANGGAK